MALKVALVLALVASLYLHRSPSLASAPVLSRVDAVVAELQRLIPSDAGRVFLLGDPLYLTLAGHRTYWQQVSNPGEGLTFLTSGYEKTGMWGRREMDQWMVEARYAVVQDGVYRTYSQREKYQPMMAILGARLLTQWRHQGNVQLPSGDTQSVWRKKP